MSYIYITVFTTQSRLLLLACPNIVDKPTCTPAPAPAQFSANTKSEGCPYCDDSHCALCETKYSAPEDFKQTACEPRVNRFHRLAVGLPDRCSSRRLELTGAEKKLRRGPRHNDPEDNVLVVALSSRYRESCYKSENTRASHIKL